jgi:hypothetical protein
VPVEAVIYQCVTISTSWFVQNVRRWQWRLARRWTTSEKYWAVTKDATLTPEKAGLRIGRVLGAMVLGWRCWRAELEDVAADIYCTLDSAGIHHLT